MRKKVIFTFLTLVAVFVLLDIFYFRFHTYFQGSKIEEPLPTLGTSQTMGVTPPVLLQGQFTEVDLIHKGYGKAMIITDAEGKKFLRLENFKVTNGPDLYVYLVNTQKPSHNIESLGNYTNLGRLKANEGNQNYEIPTNVNEYNAVVIWCKQFSVLFSYAFLL